MSLPVKPTANFAALYVISRLFPGYVTFHRETFFPILKSTRSKNGTVKHACSSTVSRTVTIYC
jgi:hypothetical protein